MVGWEGLTWSADVILWHKEKRFPSFLPALLPECYLFVCRAGQPGIWPGKKNCLEIHCWTGGSQVQGRIRYFSVPLFIYLPFFFQFPREISPKKKNPSLDPHVNSRSHDPLCAIIRLWYQLGKVMSTVTKVFKGLTVYLMCSLVPFVTFRSELW